MHHTLLVRIPQRRQDLPDISDSRIERQAPGAKHAFERLPFDIFHQQNELIFRMNRIVKRGNIGMV